MFINKNVICSSSIMWNIIGFIIKLKFFFVLNLLCLSRCRVFLKEIFNLFSQLICNNSVEQLSFFFLKFFFYKFLFSSLGHMIILSNFKLLNLNKKSFTSLLSSDFSFIWQRTASQVVFYLGNNIFCSGKSNLSWFNDSISLYLRK